MIDQRKPGSLFSTLMLVLLLPVLASAAAFRVQPESILLTDPEASQQLVISALTPAGENLDIPGRLLHGLRSVHRDD